LTQRALYPVAFWNTENAVCAKSGFSFLGLLALRFALGVTERCQESQAADIHFSN
jgi:hypothetical protein